MEQRKATTATTVQRWSGQEVRALREAKRMTLRDFAAHLGVSERMVSKWEGENVVPRPVNQLALDTSLVASTTEEQARFADALGIPTPQPQPQILRPRQGQAAPNDAPEFKTIANVGTAGVRDDDGSRSEPEPWSLVETITRSSISAQMVEHFERLTIAQVNRYPSTSPAQLWPVVQRELARAQSALEQRQSLGVQRRLIAVVGMLSGLAGNLSVDLGRRMRAAEYFELGQLAGKEADDTDLTAWALTLQSRDPFFAGNVTEAVTLLDQAAQLARTRSSVHRQSWIAALRARAHAAIGDTQSAQIARTALNEAYELLDDAGPPTGTNFFDLSRLDGIAGTTYRLLQDTAQATALIDRAMGSRPHSDAKGRALLLLDQAECHAIDQNPDGACDLLHAAFDTAEGQLIRPIVVRATEVRARMTRWQDTESLKAFTERLTDARQNRNKEA